MIRFQKFLDEAALLLARGSGRKIVPSLLLREFPAGVRDVK